jgi:hypothetical protein
MAKPKASAPAPAPAKPDVVCEPGRHVNCLHAKMAEKRKQR